MTCTVCGCDRRMLCARCRDGRHAACAQAPDGRARTLAMLARCGLRQADQGGYVNVENTGDRGAETATASDPTYYPEERPDQETEIP